MQEEEAKIKVSPSSCTSTEDWTKVSREAMESLKGGLSVKRAAELHCVLKTTLQNRVKGKVMHGVNPGPKPYLQQAEEKELSCFLTKVAAVGYGITKKQVKFLLEILRTKVFYDRHLRIRLVKCLTGGSGNSCRDRRSLCFEREIQQPKYKWKPAVKR